MIDVLLFQLSNVKKGVEKILVAVVLHLQAEHVFFFDKVLHRFRKQTI